MQLDEAKKILEDAGYTVINEGKVTQFIAGLALAAGLLTHAQAKEFNARANSDYSSKATTSIFAKDIQKSYNMGSNVNITANMVQAIAEIWVQMSILQRTWYRLLQIRLLRN